MIDPERAITRILLLLLALALAAPAGAQERLRIVGTNSAGCFAGGVALPAEGAGFQQIRASRSTFWGAPQTIASLELLAARARAAGLPDLYMNDISEPRGGPIPGHAGHAIGLEADIWLDVTPKPALTLAMRDNLEPPSVVRPDGRAVDPAIWRAQHVTLLRLAATLPGVERIFVNPAIKQELCRSVTGDRSWLHVVRPWYGHASHFHIRFVCPPGQTECVVPAPIPAGDGCDATLQWWFDQLDKPKPPPGTARPPAPLPAACRAIMAGGPQ